MFSTKIKYDLPRSGDGLACHGGAIPSSELWLKLGGDKGHGSFKLTLQLVNTAHPNSIKETMMLLYFQSWGLHHKSAHSPRYVQRAYQGCTGDAD